MKNLILPPPGNVGISFDLTVKKRRPSPGIPKWLPMLSAVLLLLACCLPRTAHAQGACGEWTQTAIGAPSSGTAQFDACAPGTITITSAGLGSSSTDLQYMVQRELCGDGTFDVKIESISNGRAGLEIRADNAPGAVKAGVKTPLSNTLTRYLRNAPGTAQSASSINAMGHRWLRLVRSGSNIQLFWSPNGTNWTSVALYTNMALPACARIGIYVESNNAAVATGVFSNLSISGVNTPATTFSFAAGSLSAEAGQSAQVCVNIANPCACAPASVQVALQGNAAPHLSGFSTQTLQFQSGDTQKCFSLATAAAPGDGSYTLVLQNPTGGNDAAIGAQSALAVAVTGEPATPTDCPWAGPDREICRGESVLIGCAEEVQPPAGTFYCYKWTPETGLDDPSLPQPTATPQQTTTYTVYVTDNKGNLVATDGVLVLVRPLPEIEILSDPKPPVLCPGGSIALEVNTGYTNYDWSLGDNPLGQISHIINATSTGVYKVTATDQYGCEASDEIEVIDGNNISDASESLKDFFENAGFYHFPVTITGPAPPGLIALPQNSLVQDDAKLLVNILDESFNIKDEMEEMLSFDSPFLTGFSANRKGFITKNSSLCNESTLLSEIQNQYHAQDFAYWAHIWDNPANNEPDLVFIQRVARIGEKKDTLPDAKLKKALNSNFGLIGQDTDPFGFSSASRKIWSIILNMVTNPTVDGDIDKQYEDSSNAPDPCITSTEVICLSPSGVPMRMPPDAKLRFNLKSEFWGEIDNIALTSFTYDAPGPLYGLYNGQVTPQRTSFAGYYNTSTGAYYEWPGPAITGQVQVQLGIRIANENCTLNYYYYNRDFIPNSALANPGGVPNRKANGPLQPDFGVPEVGSLLSMPVTADRICSLCQPDIAFNAFKNLMFLPKHPLNQQQNNHGGWILNVLNEQGGLEYIYAVYTQNSPNVPEYYRYSPVGHWVPFDPPPHIPYLAGSVRAFIEAAIEQGHLALDFAGVVPIVGEAADLINAAWYAYEGDTDNALISAGSAAVPLAGDVILKSGKFVLLVGAAIGANGIEISKIVRWADNVWRSMRGVQGPEGHNIVRTILNECKTLNFSPEQAKRFFFWIAQPENDALLKIVLDNPSLIAAWKNMDEIGATQEQAARLFTRLVDDTPLLQQFAANPGIARGWKLLDDLYGGGTASKRLWDGDLIAKTTELSNNTVFMQRLGADAETQLSALKNIISKNAHAGCNVCLPPTRLQFAYLKSIDQYLDDALYFVTQLGDKQGAETMISLMKNGAPNQIDAIAQTIRLLKENPGGKFAPGNVVRFEPKLSNTVGELASDDGINQIGDILVALASGGNKLYELKSFKKSSLSGIPTNQLNQFKAYLNNNNVTDMSRLEYIFDQRKLLRTEFENLPNFNPANYFDDVAQAEQAIKGQFQVMMQQNAGDIFQTVFNNSSLRASLSLSNDSAVAFNQFNSLVNNSNSVLFQFIKVE